MAATMLNRPTLVLNRSWQPVGVAPVSRSLVLLWNDNARVVDPHDYQMYSWADWARLIPSAGEPWIQAVRSRLRVPEVVVLTHYDRLPLNTVAFSRRNLYRRDRYTCQYCGSRPGSKELTVDHVLPRAQGGSSTWENCVLACVACNNRKAARTPQQAGMPLLKVPVRPHWRPLYATRDSRVCSWSRFLSEAYWSVELEE
ncbi:MAG: HNH endonuclease [Planctomycetes bacterium]|nr:HNH endonuclease [Planctomycetota bacterium]